MIYCHQDAKKKLFELSLDHIHRAPVYDDLGVRVQKSGHSDRTARSAIAITMNPHITRLQRITKAIALMYEEASEDCKTYITYRYWTEPPPKWTMYDQNKWNMWVFQTVKRHLENLDSPGKKQA